MLTAAANQREVIVRQAAGETLVDALSPWAAITLARQLTQAATDAATDWKPCGSCGAPMVWAVTVKGNRMPLDPGDHPDGPVAAWHEGGDSARALRSRSCPVTEELRPGEHRVMPHHASCPSADQWRRKQRRAG